ncbi:MAG: hypothetical protein Q4F02_00315 [Candidatus Saccharibacteria bacterium]|nr:hypothetical protein [Candidatus Saccharibacteria bacterium]
MAKTTDTKREDTTEDNLCLALALLYLPVPVLAVVLHFTIEHWSISYTFLIIGVWFLLVTGCLILLTLKYKRQKYDQPFKKAVDRIFDALDIFGALGNFT